MIREEHRTVCAKPSRHVVAGVGVAEESKPCYARYFIAYELIELRVDPHVAEPVSRVSR